MNVGIDIVEVERINRLIKNSRFLNKIYTNSEINYCQKKKKSAQHFAVRFAAKEAVWKALGNKKLTHKDINIRNTSQGQPEVILPRNLTKLQKKICISLSHTKHFAVAVAIKK